MYKSLYFSLSYVYGGPQLSRQNQKGHGETKNLTAKTKYLTAKPKTSRQKQNTSRQNRNLTAKTKTSRQKQNTSQQQHPHGKTKDLTAKPNTSHQKPNTSRQKQIPTAKPKLFCFCCEAFGWFGFAVRFLVLPWQLWATIKVLCAVDNYLMGNYKKYGSMIVKRTREREISKSRTLALSRKIISHCWVLLLTTNYLLRIISISSVKLRAVRKWGLYWDYEILSQQTLN